MSETERRFHEDWLGRVQPIEGLVLSVPVLTEARCMQRRGRAGQLRFAELCAPSPRDDRVHVIADLERLLFELLEFEREDFDAGDDLPADLRVYVEEGGQTLCPTLALRKAPQGDGDDAGDEAAADRYQLLVWAIPEHLDLDKQESETGPWRYTPAAKFARLLDRTGIPIGLLTNGRATRLVYSPRGQSLGAITFVTDHMLAIDGRPVLDAFWSLMAATRWFTVPTAQRLPALLQQSRERQQDVTNALAEQVFTALTLLLRGVTEAAERDGDAALRQALAEEERDLVYTGLLTVLLRMVFVLYAEDRGLLPVEHPIYEHLGLLPLFEQLQADHGDFPDTMHQRFGAWPRVLSLFRAIYFGARAGDFYLPPRHGELFSPHAFGFLEGWAGGAAPTTPEARARVAAPTVSDGTVHAVLDKLLVLDGQRLSYRALEVEQIGSVYEALMGYRVERVYHDSVCLRPQRVWLSPQQVREQPKAGRLKWLKGLGLSAAQATSLLEALDAAKDDGDALAALSKHAFRKLPVAAAGRLVIQPGEERRRTSSHYTPRSLSEPIVARTLEPLLRCMGEAPSAAQLLSLTICDPAMGSGAFLVAACRSLAAEVEKAWTREGTIEAIAAKHGKPLLHAQRLVAQRCLYGVDKNPLAVDLAKLSLWLETLADGEPFTFVDHALKCGDSLVGVFLPQVRSFDWRAPVRREHEEGPRQYGLFDNLIDKQIELARHAREKLLALAGEESRDADLCADKESLDREAEAAIERVRVIADLLVGAFFDEAKDKARDDERKRRLSLIEMWLQAGADAPLPVELRELRARARALRPFHWPVEFPEVFWGKRIDPLAPGSKAPGWVDAIVGNPPFLGGKRISTTHGDEYSHWLQQIHSANRNADLSAHFLRRAGSLLALHGAFGLVATNSIRQGETRTSGLQPLVQSGGTIFNATTTREWPGSASVSISIIHMSFGKPINYISRRMLDERPAPAINSRLLPQQERPAPTRLRANDGLSHVGSYILGAGFLLTPPERDRLINLDTRNGKCILPYIGGAELNRNPGLNFDRYVIDFGDMHLAEAECFPELLQIVRRLVKPERDKLKREIYRRRWWQFGEKQASMRMAISRLTRCLVNSQVSKHLAFAFQPTNRILAHTLYVYPFDNYGHFALLQSRSHEHWARLLSSSMRGDLRYSPTDCFETFPFPLAKHLDPEGPLEAAGKTLYEARAAFMIETDQGLTKTYNALKDPDITDPRVVRLRELHLAMDRAVLAAYGWSDLTPPPYTEPRTEGERAARQAFEDAVIDRLFALNAERAAAEKKIGTKRKK